MPTFLLEIGTEEIPDWMIEAALQHLKRGFETAFGAFGGEALMLDATPRRLVLLIEDLLEQAPDVQTVVPGPYLSTGAKAAEGFARKWSTSIDQLDKITDAKGERYIFHQLTKGQLLSDALSEKLPAIIAEGVHFPKTMYWTGKNGVRFIRPLRWIVALLDDRVVPFQVGELQSGNTTRGHRILGSQQPLEVTIENYTETLRKNFVMVRAEERRQRIEQSLGPDVRKDQDLLQTLVYLTEFPSNIRGSFDPSYLELPEEILITVMRHHQRYFSVVNEDGSLAPAFVAVTNTQGDPESLIRHGNERVLRARFNDARFFWKLDQQKKLSDRVQDLAKVTFQAKLGSYKDKTDRVVKLALELAAQTGANQETVRKAATLCKCDLTTDMVKEFTELQGVVGGLYARVQGEGDAVATAIYDHYKPTSMDDDIPRTLEGQVVSIADKLDTLGECFRIGMVPTGSKDPFALRRAAQGIVKILFEARLPVEILKLAEDVPDLPDFLRERVEYYLRDVLGYAYDEVNAVLAVPATTLADVADRVEAIHYVRPTEDFEPVAASFKRIKNILKQAQVEHCPEPDAKLLSPGPEEALYRAFNGVREAVNHNQSYREKLAFMASLRPQVDTFFDKILVNDPNSVIRQNRLALLYSLLAEFSTIADFSEIVTQGASV